MHKVLVLSSRLSDSRRTALRGLAGSDQTVDIRPVEEPGAGPEGYSGIVLDAAWGDVASGLAAGLRPWVERGGCLLVISGAPCVRPAPGAGTANGRRAQEPGWAGLMGAGPGPGRSGEWIVKVAPDHPATARVPAEIPIVDTFQPLQPPADTEVLLAVNVAYRDQPALVTRRVGAGCVVTTGLGTRDSALADPDLRLILRRCLAGGTVATGPASRGSSPVAHTRSPHRLMGMGIVGYGPYGGMGQYHGRAAQATQGLELVAACDSDVGRRKAAEADFPGLRAHASLVDLAADDDVELVVVATPPISHAPIARAMLLAGKHVALEKPMCLSVTEADELIDLAARQGLMLTVNQNRRWDPDFRAIRRVLDDGLLGDLFSMETFVGGFEHPCRAWHSEESVSGGTIYDWGAHHLDWILQLMGCPPATVTAYGHKRVWRDVTNLDQVRVHLQWDDGREAEFVQSDIAAVRKPKFYLQGTGGTLVGHYRPVAFERIETGVGYVSETAHHAEAPVDLTLVRYQSGWGLSETHLPPLPEQRYAFHRNLADHLQRGEPLAVTPQSVRPVIALIQAAEQSAREGGSPIVLEL